MGRAKKTRKFATVKRMLSPKDARLEENIRKQEEEDIKNPKKEKLNEAPKQSSALFFNYNTALGPPYQVLIDTNFINFTIQNKIEIVQGMMDCLLAKTTVCITDCVMAELEKLGPRFKLALTLAKDPRFKRIPCTHAGTYADDCLVNKVEQFKCYIVATCDRDLRRRIRKIPGIPIMYISQHKYVIERLPEAWGAPNK
eukprot:TRINITY_DN10874_c0_g1_i1.p1 TRINITY_DN10874_c0_g1~~TRINITY_DN10874_c0_g1_i1.p1  ORF type:complete len:198 (-),score=48.64 TRINITY_DN10874_c0_g1_i1:74-667(-)